jgi:hypothetical protein
MTIVAVQSRVSYREKTNHLRPNCYRNVLETVG